jgi:predicted 3-demethylubiquinone-9 3-methyltransferase (glyoxalase superfamily)
MKGITPCLWFDTEAEEAAEFYTSIVFELAGAWVTRYGEAGPGTPGQAMTVLL